MGLLKQVIGSAHRDARVWRTLTIRPLITSVLARRASQLMIALVAFLVSRALQSRLDARQPRRRAGRVRA
jgi:hypothetical protein